MAEPRLPPVAPAGPRRSGLATRITLVTVAVAVVAVLITGLVSFSLVRGAAEDQARNALGRQADLIAAQFDRTNTQPVALLRVLRREGIRINVVGANGTGPAYLSADDKAVLAAGEPLSIEATVNGERVFVEGRPLADGGSVVVEQPASAAASDESAARRRLVIPLLLGLVGAGLAGWLLSRRLARPLQDAARGAHRLASGARDVRLEPAGPAEVAELAEALNALNGALVTSEGREREFLLSVSHELRTPLTAVRGYAEALADGVVPPGEVARTGATVLDEANRLERLVADLLDLARLRAQDFRLDVVPVDLGGLVKQAGEVWRARCLPYGVDLRVEVPAFPVVVRTDPVRVRQIIDGLAENALRVVPSGAPIVLAVHPLAGGAVVEVRDGGPGLSDDDLRVAFDRAALYERYRGVRRVGTGFGLALVQGLTQRLGGTATAGHAPEGGARFSAALPSLP